MSLKHMEGFDSILDRSDLMATGWRTLTVLASACGSVAGAKSINGKSGKSLALVGPTPTANTGYYPMQTTSVLDYGVLQLPGTVKDYWDAGGFTFGCRAQLNNGFAETTGPAGTSIYQFAVDGTSIYALTLSSKGYRVLFSTDDGVTWSYVPNVPLTLDQYTTVSVINGTLILTPHNVAAGTARVYSTSDYGGSWQQTSAIAGITGLYNVVATGDVTWPYAVAARGPSDTTAGMYLLNGLGASASIVKPSAPNPGNNAYALRVKTVAGFVVAAYSTGVVLWGKVSQGLQNASAWTSRAYTSLGFSSIVTDVEFAANRWYLCSANNGVLAATNPGILPDIEPPAITAMSPVTSTSGVALSSTTGLARIGQTLLAVGPQARVGVSTDGGMNWDVSQGRYLLKTTAASWLNCVATANAFYAMSTSSSSIVAKTPNGATAWEMLYAGHPTEGSPQYVSMLGVYCSSGFNANGTLAGPSGSFTIMLGNITTARQRALTVRSINVAVGSTTLNNDEKDGVRYFELVAERDPATANSFFLSLRIDGTEVLAKSASSYALAPVNDTTSILVFNIPRTAQIVRLDDLYVTDFLGNTPKGFVGPSVIVPRRPLSDVQAQWEKQGAAASNAQSVRKVAQSADNGDLVVASGSPFIDVYAADTYAPQDFTGYRALAMKVELYGARQVGTVPKIKIGVVSGGTTDESADIELPNLTMTYNTATFDTDPATGSVWTVESILAADLSLNKTA